MTGLALLLLVASLGVGIALRFRLPAIPLLMVGGVLLSFFASPLLGGAQLRDILALGLAFLVFSSGVELNPARFLPQRHAVPWVGVIQFGVLGIAAYLMAGFLGFEQMTSIYLAFSLAASSTLVALRHLKQHQQMFEPFGRLVIGVLFLQDALVIGVITVLSTVDDGAGWAALKVAATAGMGFLAIFLQRRVVPRLFERLKLDEETLLLAFLSVLFAFVGLAYWIGIPSIAGAFFAGILLSGTPVNGVVRGLLGSLNDFFLALFFTTLGAAVIVPDLDLLLKGLALAMVVIVVTPPVVTIVAEWTGLSARASIESGLLLAQTSEFSMVLALVGLQTGHLDKETFSVIALITVATMTVTPFIATDSITWKLLGLHPGRRRLEVRADFRDHVLMIGFGSGGMWTLNPLLEAGNTVVVIDDDPSVVEQLARSGVRCVRGDGSDADVLRRAGARNAKIVLANVRRMADAEKILAYAAGETKVLVRTFEERDGDRVRALGGIPVLNSHAAAETFSEWFEGRF